MQAQFNLGRWSLLDGTTATSPLYLPADHLVTHGVVVGMTGSGKTGLLTVLAEEALRNGIPVIAIDVKGDLPNLLLSIPDFSAESIAPWVEPDHSPVQAAAERKQVMEAWGVTEADVGNFATRTDVRIVTPGATIGEPLHVLSMLERRSSRWDTDPEAARDALSAAVSLVLRLIGRDPDPARSKEHVLLRVLAERRLAAGKDAELGQLMQDVMDPPLDRIGALPVDSFLKRAERKNLAAALNTLLASPSFTRWRQGASLDVAAWLKPRNGRTPAVIVSVANPPTKRPMVALMRQARGFGVGVVVATQNLGRRCVCCVGR